MSEEKSIEECQSITCEICGLEGVRHLLPEKALTEVIKVLEFGSRKYSPHGWKTNGDEDDYEAANRHIHFWSEGGNHDHESNLRPLAHAICRLAFILDRELER